MQTFQDAVKSLGLAAIAEACGVSPQAVHKWLTKGIPPERVIAVEAVTGIHRSRLRSDIYPPDKKQSRVSASKGV